MPDGLKWRVNEFDKVEFGSLLVRRAQYRQCIAPQ